MAVSVPDGSRTDGGRILGRMKDDILIDLVRSAWIIERARASVYEGWAGHDSRFEASGERALKRASIIERSLESRGRSADESFIEPHANWIRNLVGQGPEEVPFGELFAIRLADWVDAHAGPFLDDGAGELAQINEDEKRDVPFPETLPAPPRFVPTETIALEPPGEVRFTFGILSDIHIGSPRGETMARAAVADLNASGAELVVQLGDLTDHGNEDEFARAADVVSALEMPFLTMMGNHDIFSYKEEALIGRELYQKYLGRAPDGQLLEHKGIRFAALDSAEELASPFPPFNLVTGTFMEGKGGAVVRGALTDHQHEILAEVAAPGSPPAFVFLHHPPQPFLGFPPILFGLREADSGRLHAVCDSGNVWGIFAGHTHRNTLTTRFGDIPSMEVAIPRDFPFGYALVDVTDEGYYYRFVQLSDKGLCAEAHKTVSAIHHRYGLGSPGERAFVWRRSS